MGRSRSLGARLQRALFGEPTAVEGAERPAPDPTGPDASSTTEGQHLAEITSGESSAEIVLAHLARRPDAPREPDAFLRWCAERDPAEPPDLSRFLFLMWKLRADLHDAFPGIYLDSDARERYRLWAHHFLVAETGAPPELVPDAPTGIDDIAEVPPTTVPMLDDGVTVVGYLRAILGLGEAGRRLVHLLTLSGERVRAVPYDETDAPLGVAWPDPPDDDRADLDVLLLAVNAAETPTTLRAVGRRARHGRYVIAQWFWEMEAFDPAAVPSFAGLDEIWVASRFTADAVSAVAPAHVAVTVVPIGLTPPAHEPPRGTAQRAEFGLPAGAVIVGNVFDYASRIERKNPIGLIEAWCEAFPSPTAGRHLAFKTVNAARFAADAATVERAARGRPDISLLDAELPPGRQELLVAQFDAVASMHRSEGYGLTLLAAMHAAKPVIATQYSGNLEFMRPDTAWLLPARPVLLDADRGPYPAGGRWSEPSHEHAVAAIREVVDGIDTGPVRQRAQAGREAVRELVDGRLGAGVIRSRLDEIRAITVRRPSA